MRKISRVCRRKFRNNSENGFKAFGRGKNFKFWSWYETSGSRPKYPVSQKSAWILNFGAMCAKQSLACLAGESPAAEATPIALHSESCAAAGNESSEA